MTKCINRQKTGPNEAKGSAPAQEVKQRATRLDKIKKLILKSMSFSYIGELGRVRTADPLIKSQMLYRLSYEPVNQQRSYV